jgi:hypothetical protein
MAVANRLARAAALPRARALVLALLPALGVAIGLVPSRAVWAADTDEIAELRRAVEALRAENRALAARLTSLEGSKPTPASTSASASALAGDRIEQRVKELELGKTAQEDAVRAIIRDSVSSLGSKINDAVSLSGAIEFGAQRQTDFTGARKSEIALGTVEFEFEVQVNPWVVGNIKFEYVDGKNLALATASGSQATIDRISLDTATISLGDPQRFPVMLRAGKMVLPFGISTGRTLGDVLSLGSPLTVEVFEAKQNAVGVEFAFPTPALRPPTPAVVAPRVRGLLIEPWVSGFGQRLGYNPPPTRLSPLAPVDFAPEAPPFHAGLYVFDARTPGGLAKHLNATLGYQTKGHCGRPYDELRRSDLCPWTLGVALGFNSSVFSSRFFEEAYNDMLPRVGRVPGASASVKASLGPLSLIGEWNGAARSAQFADDLGTVVRIRPAAWQLALGYQFDWNPWVQEIGAQGSYVGLGYSQSSDLAGVTRLIDGSPTRVGLVPKRRLLLTAGEWVADGVRVALEYSREWDYSLSQGGTGQAAQGLTLKLTYAW